MHQEIKGGSLVVVSPLPLPGRWKGVEEALKAAPPDSLGPYRAPSPPGPAGDKVNASAVPGF